MRVMVTRRRGASVEHIVLRAPPDATEEEARDFLGIPFDVGPDRAVATGSARGEVRSLLHGLHLPRDECCLAGAAEPSGATSGPWVVVATGPDAGGAAPLRPGDWLTVGRDPSCDLQVHDPGLSRRHARIRQERDAVRVEDLGSTNGIRWERSGETPTWPAGDRLVLGGSTLVLVPRGEAPAYAVLTEGRLEVAPWSRAAPEPAGVTLRTPPPPSLRKVRRPSAWSWALPLVLAVAVASLLRMPWLMLFGLLGPAMVLGAHLGERRTARQEYAEACQQHEAARAEMSRSVRRHLRADLATRRTLDPGLVGVVTTLVPRVARSLWDCGAEPLRVVLGEGTGTSSVTRDETTLMHDRAPVVLELDGPVVVVGAQGARDGLARSLLLQLATRYPPTRLCVTVDPSRPPGPGWDLLAWLPHSRLDNGGHAGHVLRWEQDLMLLDDPAAAPTDVTRVVVHGPRHAVLQRSGSPDVPFCPSTLSLPRARHLARRLAPLRAGATASSVESGHPTGQAPTTLGELLPWPSTTEEARTGWRAQLGGAAHGPARDLAVPVGLAPDGLPLSVDLARDGPHALVAGTTGSGKSELLRTLVAGLALRCSPADLAMLLIDYKGGASLGDCAALPHVAGLLTDLDPHLAERVLISLQAELRRREKVLHGAGARDIRDYVGGDLPRLVVVIDEFRVMAEEVPEVMEGLVRLAAVGRSLGVHLVLATQRPAGVVSADLRANVNLRIALRVRDAADSYDVLECVDAAQLPEGRPGLALLRTGGDPPRVVQVTVAAPRPPVSDATVAWEAERFQDVWQARIALENQPARRSVDLEQGVTDLAQVLTAAATEAGLGPPRVWLPPLPDLVVPDPVHPTAWAVADLPGEQRRQHLTWRADGHLAVVGSARTGRSTALQSLVQGAGAVWTVILDLGRGLAAGPLPQHPGRCAWVEPDDLAHGARVLDRVLEVTLARQADPGSDRTPLVVVLDGWDRFVELFGELDRGRSVDVTFRILREGPAVGVVVVASGDRSLLLGKVAGMMSETWALRFNDPSDLLLTGLRARQLPHTQPPGRMVRVRDGVVAQVVLPGTPWPPASIELPAGPEYLPTESTRPLHCVALPRVWRGDETLSWAVGGDEAHPLRSPEGSLLVLGPPGSGKSQALAALIRAHEGSVVPVQGADPPEVEVLREVLGSDMGTGLVTVDDAHLLAGTGVEELLCNHLTSTRVTMLVGADLDSAGGAFRGLVPQVARFGTAVVLQPRSPAQGAIVNVSLPVGDLPLPGRGVLVSRGRCTRVQVSASNGSGPLPVTGGR